MGASLSAWKVVNSLFGLKLVVGLSFLLKNVRTPLAAVAVPGYVESVLKSLVCIRDSFFCNFISLFYQLINSLIVHSRKLSFI
jgi:hypothetical protein